MFTASAHTTHTHILWPPGSSWQNATERCMILIPLVRLLSSDKHNVHSTQHTHTHTRSLAERLAILAYRCIHLVNYLSHQDHVTSRPPKAWLQVEKHLHNYSRVPSTPSTQLKPWHLACYRQILKATALIIPHRVRL